ncbi:MAG TPA: DUF222 domain-containing protein [Nocardioides sp.]|nr:DUF222 domain-containing protein [Nocardioides sp.]
MTLIQDPPRQAGSAPAGAAGPGGPRLRAPVLRFTDSMGRALDDLVEVATWSMSEAELGEALVELTREEARLVELRLRVLREADARRVGHEQGSVSTAAWLAQHTKLTRQAISADVHLTRDLEDEFTLTGAAMAGRLVPASAPGAASTATDPAGGAEDPEGAGADGPRGAAGADADKETPRPGVVDVEKARIIIRAVRSLVRDHGDLVTAEVRRSAEAHLVDLAARFDAPTLKQLAKRLVEVVCPEAADAAEGKKLDAEEQAARKKAYVSIKDHGDGTSTGVFKIPTLHADLFRKVLDELTSPGKLGDERIDPETGRPLSTSTLRGRGFLILLENHLDLNTLPGSAGSPFTLVVSVQLDVLETGIGVAAVETGHRISAGEARRLACKAGIIPMVLDGASMPLDLGRERRLFSKHQKIALDHQYQGCAAETCDLPPSRVEYHHTHPWHRGGRTDLKDGLPFCPPHHHMADHPEQWDMRRLATGAIRFTRRT